MLEFSMYLFQYNTSKASKEDCTLLITLLLEHYGIDPKLHYSNYPEEENESSSESSYEEEEELDEDGEEDKDDDELEEFVTDENNGNDLAERVNKCVVKREMSI